MICIWEEIQHFFYNGKWGEILDCEGGVEKENKHTWVKRVYV